MPYLQLDAPKHYATDVKRALAKRMGEFYARIMQTTPNTRQRCYSRVAGGQPVELQRWRA